MTSSDIKLDKRRRTYVRMVGDILHTLNQALAEEHRQAEARAQQGQRAASPTEANEAERVRRLPPAHPFLIEAGSSHAGEPCS